MELAQQTGASPGGKLFIGCHGCQMNEYDMAQLRTLLAQSHGLGEATCPEEADVLLLQTCSIREKAQEKVFHQLGRWRRLKQRNPRLLIGVGGCVASQEGDALLQRAPFVDIVFGPQTLQRVPDMIDQVRAGSGPVVDVRFPEMEKFDRLPAARSDAPSAMVSIMEGCSKYCSFCVVPYTRGEEFSRPFDDVITEISLLAQQGVREVTLLGQNVNAYRGRTHDGGVLGLDELIRYIATLEGIGRIRFTTSHPAELSDRLIDVYGQLPQLANHLHLPVQSGSDRVLAAMKRGYSVLEYKSRIRRLRRMRPDISLSSDFIVGFPGESDADFAATERLVQEIGFDRSFSFLYSRRPGTPAASLPGQVPAAVGRQRLARLQQLLEEQAQAISRAMVGTVQEVLVTGPSRKNPAEWQGRSSSNHVLNFPPPGTGKDEAAELEETGRADLTGRFVALRVNAALPHSLRGTLIP